MISELLTGRTGRQAQAPGDRVGPFPGFSGQNYSAVAADLAAALLLLDPSAEAKRQARYDLLGCSPIRTAAGKPPTKQTWR